MRNYFENSGTGAFINLPTRQRKSNYDVNEYYRARMDSNKNIPGVRKRKVTTNTYSKSPSCLS